MKIVKKDIKKLNLEFEKEKFDLTDVGHWYGTGIVNFSNEKIEIK